MKKLGMMYKIVCIFFIVIIIGGFSFVHLFKIMYEKDLVAQARVTAQQVLIFRKWAAGFGGVWTKGKFSETAGYLMQISAPKAESEAYSHQRGIRGEKLQDLENIHFYLHNPALATRELSVLTSEENGWSFKAVSDRYMAPQDKPDSWESHAIQLIKDGKQKEGETWGWDGKKLRYAKAIYVKKSCLSCHGTPEQIHPIFMKALKAKYHDDVEKAINYKVGDLRGIISVTVIPHELVSSVLSSIDIWIVFSVVLIFLVFLGFAVLIRKDVIRPIKKLTDAAEAISLGDLDIDLGVEDLKDKDLKDEIVRLTVAFDRMRSSLKSALRRLREKAKGNIR